MYVITVTFEIGAEHIDAFRTLMLKQAENSIEKETGCKQFDVCFASDETNQCFLYEKYEDQTAFETHLASDHFREFDAAVQPWIVSKQVGTWIEETESPVS